MNVWQFGAPTTLIEPSGENINLLCVTLGSQDASLKKYKSNEVPMQMHPHAWRVEKKRLNTVPQYCIGQS